MVFKAWLYRFRGFRPLKLMGFCLGWPLKNRGHNTESGFCRVWVNFREGISGSGFKGLPGLGDSEFRACGASGLGFRDIGL